MGRKKQIREPRQNFTMHLSEGERSRMEVNARQNNMTASDYIRYLIMHGGVVDLSIATDRRDVINQIAWVGNNINQYVKLANSDKNASKYLTDKLEEYLQEIKQLLLEVVRLWQ